MIPIDHLDYAIRNLPPPNMTEGESYKVPIPPPPPVYKHSGAVCRQTPLRVLIFVKTNKSWALDGWEGY